MIFKIGFKDIREFYTDEYYKGYFKLINNNKDKPWNWEYLSKNENITVDFIKNNLEKPWNWKYLSKNPNITWEFIENNLDKDWDWKYLSKKSKSFDHHINFFYETIREGKRTYLEYLKKNSNFKTRLEIIENPDTCDLETIFKKQFITWKIIENTPDKTWDWRSISINPNITWEIINNNQTKPWKDKILYNQNITWDIIESSRRNLRISSQSWASISKRSDVTWEIIENNPNIPWDWSSISKNPNITLEIIEKNPDKPWVWSSILQNPSCFITFEMVEKNIDKSFNWKDLTDFLANYRQMNEDGLLSQREKAPMWLDIVCRKHARRAARGSVKCTPARYKIVCDIIEKNPDKPWDWKELSLCSNIRTSEFIQKNIDKPWDWDFLSKKITWDIIENNPDKPWDWERLSCNENITWDIIENNPDKPWDWEGLSCNENITWDIIENNPDKPWDWMELLSRNKNITSKFIENNIDKPWDWWELSRNKNITWDIIIKYRNKLEEQPPPAYQGRIMWQLENTREIAGKLPKRATRFVNWVEPMYWESEEKDGPKMTWDECEAAMTKDKMMFKTWTLDWEYIFTNQNITWDIIIKYRDYVTWNLYFLSKNPSITWEIVKKIMSCTVIREWESGDWSDDEDDDPYQNSIVMLQSLDEKTADKFGVRHIELKLQEEWSWYHLSKNPNITWDIIENNPDSGLYLRERCAWDWHGISLNENITWDIIENNQDKPWDWENISFNKNITWDIIEKNPDKPWNWTTILYNENITWDIIEKNPEKPWNWRAITLLEVREENWLGESREVQRRWLRAHGPCGDMIKKKIKIAIKKKINYKILSKIFDSDICEMIVNF